MINKEDRDDETKYCRGGNQSRGNESAERRRTGKGKFTPGKSNGEEKKSEVGTRNTSEDDSKQITASPRRQSENKEDERVVLIFIHRCA